MDEGQKYDSFYNKVIDYHKKKLLIRLKKTEKDKQGNYTKEYGRLVKAKKDILNKTKDVFNGALTFTEIISYGDLPKDAQRDTGTWELSQNENLKDYNFVDEKEYVKVLLSDEAQQFVMKVFNDKTVDKLLSTIFFSGILTNKINESETYQRSKNYRIVMAKKMIKKGINELKQYLPDKWEEFLTPKLDEAIAICDLIDKSREEIERERINKEIDEIKHRK